VHKKSKSEINLIKSKLKEEEEKFIEFRQLKLLKSMEGTDELSKKKNKRRAKKKVVLNQQHTTYLKEETKEQTYQETSNSNSPSLTPTLITA
jgi:hypothetical protein